MIKETEKEGEKVHEHGRWHGDVRSDACVREGLGVAMGADK